jgi:hypothetical protein
MKKFNVAEIVTATAVTAVVAVRRLTRCAAFDPKRWTDRKRELVQGSWSKLKNAKNDVSDDYNDEKVEVGVDVFRRLFTRHPGWGCTRQARLVST